MSNNNTGVQLGIFTPNAYHASFLTLYFSPTASVGHVIRGCSAATPITREVAAKWDVSSRRVTATIGLSWAMWKRLRECGAVSSPMPKELKPTTSFEGPGGVMPARNGDLFIHIKAPYRDACFEVSRRLVSAFGGPRTVHRLRQVDGFRYLESRDLSGFEDGTENPPDDEGRIQAAAIPQDGDDPRNAGGSYVLGQEWIHDLENLWAKREEDQEKVIGRTKAESIELDDDERPENAHISRTAIADNNGDELQVVRQSMPFGDALRHGLFFISYHKSLENIERQMRRMVGGTRGEGPHDALMGFSSCVASQWFYVPSEHQLSRLSQSLKRKNGSQLEAIPLYVNPRL